MTSHRVLDVLRTHRSIRKYQDKPIAESVLRELFDAARQASTSSNFQAYSLVKVTDPEKRTTLAKLCADQPWVAACPVFVVVCADLHRLDLVCRHRGYALNDASIEMFIVAVVDAALVAQNLLVAAESVGLGGCMIGGVRHCPDPICRLLHLPEKTFPLIGLCLGYPAHEPMIKPRLPHEVVVHDEIYTDTAFHEQIDAYDAAIRATGLYDGDRRKVPAPDGRIVPEEAYGWSEHTARRAAATDPETVRSHMRAFLTHRGFHLE